MAINEDTSFIEYNVEQPTQDFVTNFDTIGGTTDVVLVTVDGVLTDTPESSYTVQQINHTTWRVTPEVQTGSVVRLYRVTDLDQMMHVFTAGAKFIARNMDNNFKQIRHSQQEVRDGFGKLSEDTYEIIDTLQVVGQAAQDAADAAEQAAITANDAAAQVNDKVSYQDLDNAVEVAIGNGVDASFVVDGNKTQKQINDATYSTVESVADMIAIVSPKNKQKVQTLSFYSSLGRGGAYYVYDTTKSAINNGITIINGWVLQWDGKNLDLLQAGCYGDGDSDTPHEDGVKIGECLNILFALGGGSLQGRGFSYLNETTNYDINTDNIFVVNAKIIRNGTLNNWIFRTATTKEINGGGFINVEGKGNSTVAIGNGFITMGSNNFKHNKWVLQDIVADNFSQYGVGFYGGDDWYAKNIKVLNHGLTVGALSSCMGFFVYPRNPGGSKGGVLDTVYSEIGTTAQANSSLNAAAIKLQTHREANFKNITAVGGSEQCIVIDSIDGEIKNVTVYPQGERVGLNVGNYNTAHEFSGQKFILDGFNVVRTTGSGNYDLTIGASAMGQYQLDGCTIKNGKTQGFFGLARTTFKDCVFENIQTTGVRLSPKYQSFEENTVKSTGNIFRNVTASTSGFIVETNDSLIESCGTTAKTTTNGVIIVGDGNIVTKPVCVSSANSLTLYTGSLGNFIDSPITKTGTGRAIFFMGGSANNIVKQPTYLGSDSVLNSGDVSNSVEFVKSAGLTPASTAADIVAALQSAGLAT